MASRQRPLSANFVAVGDLREQKSSKTASRARSNRLKTPLYSSRSNFSQESADFGSDELSVSGSGVAAFKNRPKKDSSRLTSSSAGLWKQSKFSGETKNNRGDRDPVPKKSATSTKKSSSKSIPSKPAWFISSDGIPSETPRSDISKATYSVPPQRPSIDEFLDFENATVDEERIQSARRKEENLESNDYGHNSKSFLITKESNNAKNDRKLKGFYEEFQSGSGAFFTQATNTEEQKPFAAQNATWNAVHVADTRGNADHKIVDETEFKRSKSGDDAVDGSWGSVEGIEKKTDDYLIEMREKAAVAIQRWFRRAKIRRTAGAAAIKRMMTSKKEEMQTRLSYEREQAKSQHNSEMERLKRREEKARLARKAAIEELQKKREDKRVRDKVISEHEIGFLQESGKISKQKSQPKTKSKTKKVQNTTNSKGADNGKGSGDVLQGRPETASSVGRKVNEIFEGSTYGRSNKDGQTDVISTDRTDSNAHVSSSKVESEARGSTFDDLMNTLKELEAEPPELTNPKKPVKGVWGPAGKGEEELQYLSTEKLQSLDSASNQRQQNNPLLTADKLRNIMNFLDEVDKAEQDIRSELSRSRVAESIVSDTVNLFDETTSPDKMMDSASQVASEISNAINAQKDELDERKKSVNLLQKALQQQREFSTTHQRELDKEHKQQLALQRQEYEATIQRHLSFIDQLIDDKKVLSQRCEELVKKLKDTDQRYSSKLKTSEGNHAVELKKQKEIMEAAEKLRREKWIHEKTTQIKEMTVKGLEPDIQKLIAKHKAEIKKLKAMQQGELLEADERCGRKYIKQIEELRAHLEIEKEAAVQRERDIARQRYEKQLEQEEQAYQQQRRRLYAEVQEEKERVSQQMLKINQETAQGKQAVEESYRQTILTMQEEHSRRLDEIERKHNIEADSLKEQLELEKQQWIENYMKKQDTYLLSKERELKENVREARDKEIEMVISRLEQESTQARDETERAAENRIKRIRDKYENEIKELERSERSLQERYSDVKERSNEIENELIRIRSQLKQKDQEMIDVKSLTEQLQHERGKVTDIVRQEFADRLVTTEEDNKRLRNDVSEMRARHRIELERVSKEKEHEMEEVHKRVKIAISKKEETMQILRQQMQAAEKRADHLEMLLTEQRKKLMR